MTRFVERAIARAGLGSVVTDRAQGNFDSVRARLAEMPAVDLLVLGAVADAVRTAEAGDVVTVHASRRDAADGNVVWVDAREHQAELDLLRAVALARITGPHGVRVGVDWGQTGLELAQVALGFGATDLVGPITRKSGLVILETDKKKVKGQGLVAASALKRREIAALVHNAGRLCTFTDTDDEPEVATTSDGPGPETAHA